MQDIGTVPARPASAGAVASGIEDLIGSTPLLEIRFEEAAAGSRVLAKLESANPLSSSKDRVALHMLRAAELRGELEPGNGTVVEATSGNTGISLAALAASRGYRCVIVLPDNATRERIRLLRALGAEVVRTPSEHGYQGAIAKAAEIHARTPGAWFPRQHENQENVLAHYETTGPELYAAARAGGARIDTLVCGVGTGGTLTGTARYLTERDPATHVVAVEPASSPVLSQGTAGRHRIPGLNGGFVAATTDVTLIDEIVTVSDRDALRTARYLARRHGLFVGVSSGAAAHACAALVAQPEYAGRTVATVFPDTGERYLSMWDEDGGEQQPPSPARTRAGRGRQAGR